jgi:hypothetical protein
LKIWIGILGNPEFMQYVDQKTVELLQLMAPGQSEHDLLNLKGPFFSQQLFPGVTDQDQRQVIWQNIQQVPSLIPSLYTFFQDIKYLKSPERIMRRLFNSTECTIRTIAQQSFQGDDSSPFLIQESENFFRQENGAKADQIMYSYREMWLYVCRFSSDPKMEAGLDTQLPQKHDQIQLLGAAKLANKLGFNNRDIDELLGKDIYRDIAVGLLQELNSPVTEFNISQLIAIHKEDTTTIIANQAPTLLHKGLNEPIRRRCGRVFERAYTQTREDLFLEKMENSAVGQGSVSPLFVRIAVYVAFFGRVCKSDFTNPKSNAIRRSPVHAVEAVIDLRRNVDGFVETQESQIVESQIVEGQVVEGQVVESQEESGSQEVGSKLQTLRENTTQGVVSIQIWENNIMHADCTSGSYDETQRMLTKREHKYAYTNLFIVDIYGRDLTKANCYIRAIENRSNTIILIPGKVQITKDFVKATEGVKKRLRVKTN